MFKYIKMFLITFVFMFLMSVSAFAVTYEGGVYDSTNYKHYINYVRNDTSYTALISTDSDSSAEILAFYPISFLHYSSTYTNTVGYIAVTTERVNMGYSLYNTNSGTFVKNATFTASLQSSGDWAGYYVCYCPFYFSDCSYVSGSGTLISGTDAENCITKDEALAEAWGLFFFREHRT